MSSILVVKPIILSLLCVCVCVFIILHSVMVFTLYHVIQPGLGLSNWIPLFPHHILWCLYNHWNCLLVKKPETQRRRVYTRRDSGPFLAWFKYVLKPWDLFFFNAQEVLLCKLQKHLKNRKLREDNVFPASWWMSQLCAYAGIDHIEHPLSSVCRQVVAPPWQNSHKMLNY